ncbi:hypothetical protein K2Y11_09640 [bacterium]|nr:hypothetical protein [bacterium]
MDPNQTYLDLIDAMEEEDHETARALALALKRWIKSGGFLPYEFTKEEIENYILDVLRRTDYLNE